MPYADSNSIQTYCFVREKIADRAATFAAKAEKLLKSWISKSVYDALEDATEIALVKQAESLLAMSFALPQLNMRFSDLGGLSKIIGQPGESSEELMSLREVKMYAAHLQKVAFELIEDLVPDLDDPDSFAPGTFGINATTNYAAE